MRSTAWAGFGVAVAVLVAGLRWLGQPDAETSTPAPVSPWPGGGATLRSNAVPAPMRAPSEVQASSSSSSLAANPFGGAPTLPSPEAVPAAPTATATATPVPWPVPPPALTTTPPQPAAMAGAAPPPDADTEPEN